MTFSSLARSIRNFFAKLWQWFRSRSRTVQVALAAVVLVILIAILIIARGGAAATTATATPTVTLEQLDAFGGTTNGVSVLGTVQSVSEADILAQSGGTVTAVNARIGANVPAGFVIASLDNAAASAAVLQAQGGYDAAVAAAKATTLNAQNTAGSFAEAQTSARTTYQSDFTATESALVNDVDQVFGDNTPTGPELLIQPGSAGDTFSRQRRDIDTLMDQWQASLATVNTADPLALLSDAQGWLATIASFLTDLDATAAMQESGATAAQLSALATAQTAINSELSGISAARNAYNAAQTAAAVSQTQGANAGSSDGVTSAEASVESALGALRSAQAAYEKTVIRAPIAGTVNFLPINVGDYASQNEHVATVARNNALEVVMQLSQSDAERLAVGDSVTIGTADTGVVTTIAPALGPTTKQIEVDIAVNGGSSLVNGQSVQVALPALASDAGTAAASSAQGSGANTRAATSTSSTTPATITVGLPLTAVKLLPNERDVFTVDAAGHLVANAVTIGDVIGDRIMVTTSLPADAAIVTDARGLSAGDAVLIASSTGATLP